MQKPKYVDFDLQIWKSGDQYIAEVRNSPAGSSGREVLQWPYEINDELVSLLGKAIAEARKSANSRGPMSASEQRLRDFGSAVFSTVFRRGYSIAEKYSKSIDLVQSKPDVEGLRLKLSVESPELAMLPWEYIFDESDQADNGAHNYICMQFRSPLVRFLQGKQHQMPAIKRPLRIAGMICNPTDDKDLAIDIEQERRLIEKALEDVPKDLVSFTWLDGTTIDDLRVAMLGSNAHVFHFIGHGGTDICLPDRQGTVRTNGFIVMQNEFGEAERVSAERLALALNNQVRLVVLNCCESGRGGSFSSIGADMVRAGIPLAVAMQFPIANGSASYFSSEFYRALGQGKTPEYALTYARRAMRSRVELDWGIPVLFTRAESTTALFPEVATQSASPTKTRSSSVPLATKRKSAREELRKLFA
ncbi:CHAT domain-containing protein [Cupriavidus sp. YR651]|uniref:CHAT domain-containing protein n=1 Tax=Cupriavidus sp. YR651 TaxID=1855315 RepID=UPI00088DE898|nr:CHAT domain-containing protein [Cupriavidus sp. YR651]SDD63862.1 CHAT domain-containing protein [Cupriavidus sp. YR651]